MIQLKKVTPYYTAQIFQAIAINFAFCHKITDKSYEQCHLAVKCRDFLGDVIWSNSTKQPASIYSFHYDVNKDLPIDKDKTRLSLTFPDQQSMECFQKNFELVNEAGVKAGVEHSTFYITDDKLTLIVEADKLWQSAQWKFSLFGFYLKLASYPSFEGLGSPEKEYYPLLTPNIEKQLLSQIKEDKTILEDNMSKAHNFSGWVSVVKNQNPILNKLLLS